MVHVLADLLIKTRQKNTLIISIILFQKFEHLDSVNVNVEPSLLLIIRIRPKNTLTLFRLILFQKFKNITLTLVKRRGTRCWNPLPADLFIKTRQTNTRRIDEINN